MQNCKLKAIIEILQSIIIKTDSAQSSSNKCKN